MDTWFDLPAPIQLSYFWLIFWQWFIGLVVFNTFKKNRVTEICCFINLVRNFIWTTLIQGYALKCYTGAGAAGTETVAKTESECGETIKMCLRTFTEGKNEIWIKNVINRINLSFSILTVGEVYAMSCALTADAAEGCTDASGVSTCYCGTDLCNGQVKFSSSLALMSLSLIPFIFKLI